MLVDGCFDGLHPGHLAYLEAARTYGPLLCVVADDETVRQKHPVLLPQADRARVIQALAVMRDGEVLTYPPGVFEPIASTIRRVKPTHYVKGQDWQGRLPEGIVAACAAVGTEIVFTDTQTYSSTALLQKLQPDVDAFERLVLSQQPAGKPWEPVTDYSFDARRTVEGEHPQLIKEVFQPHTAFDYGCGPGHLIALLRYLGISAEGYEPSSALKHLEQPVVRPHIYRDWRPARQFDLVICREVLEHCTIREIRRLVSILCAHAAKWIYVTTRFSTARHFLDFATADDLDPTHISIMPKSWLRHLFILEGFKSRPDLEIRLDWQHKGRVLVYERAA